jgi:hypothetical protein
MNTTQIQAMAASWGRSFLAAAIAVYMSGNHDLKAIAGAGLAAVLPVVLRALNPNDGAFGVGASK